MRTLSSLPFVCPCFLYTFHSLALVVSLIFHNVQKPYTSLHPVKFLSSFCTSCSSESPAFFFCACAWIHLSGRCELQRGRAGWWRRGFHQWKALDRVLRHIHDKEQPIDRIYLQFCGLCMAKSPLPARTVTDASLYSLIAKRRQN